MHVVVMSHTNLPKFSPQYGDLYGTRTHVASVKGRCPNQLDEETNCTSTSPSNLQFFIIGSVGATYARFPVGYVLLFCLGVCLFISG